MPEQVIYRITLRVNGQAVQAWNRVDLKSAKARARLAKRQSPAGEVRITRQRQHTGNLWSEGGQVFIPSRVMEVL